jgi:hypothetical protein
MLDFAKLIHIVNSDKKLLPVLEHDLKKYEEEYYIKGDDSDKNIHREKLINFIQREVLSKAIECDALIPEVKASVRRTLMRIKYMRTSDEILGFFKGALKSPRGLEVTNALHSNGLKAFVDLADEISEKFSDNL